jgi:hypothetical protein
MRKNGRAGTDYLGISGLVGAVDSALLLNALIDFLAMDGNLFWRINSYPHLITLDSQDRYRDIVANHQGLTDSTR